MLRLVLLKVGRKHTFDYRIVVREAKSAPRSKKYIELVGTYNTKTKKFAIDREGVIRWFAHGVKASGTVHNLLVTQGVVPGPKVAVTPRIRPSATLKEAKPAQEGSSADSADEQVQATVSAAEEAGKETEKKEEEVKKAAQDAVLGDASEEASLAPLEREPRSSVDEREEVKKEEEKSEKKEVAETKEKPEDSSKREDGKEEVQPETEITKVP